MMFNETLDDTFVPSWTSLKTNAFILALIHNVLRNAFTKFSVDAIQCTFEFVLTEMILLFALIHAVHDSIVLKILEWIVPFGLTVNLLFAQMEHKDEKH